MSSVNYDNLIINVKMNIKLLTKKKLYMNYGRISKKRRENSIIFYLKRVKYGMGKLKF